jgi:hypothetical protein
MLSFIGIEADISSRLGRPDPRRAKFVTLDRLDSRPIHAGTVSPKLDLALQTGPYAAVGSTHGSASEGGSVGECIGTSAVRDRFDPR